MISAHIDFRIPFQDVDSMRVVWHGNYIRYFEQARCELLRKLGYTYTQMEKLGFVFPVVRLETKYIAPARFDENVRVEASLVKNENCLEIRYLMTSLDSQKKLCKARTRQMAVRLDGGESLFELPEPMLSHMRTL